MGLNEHPFKPIILFMRKRGAHISPTQSTIFLCFSIWLGCSFSADAATRLAPATAHDVLDAQEARFGVGATYLGTQSNFGTNSSVQSLCSGCRFQSITGTIFFEFGFVDAITGFADLGFMNNTAEGTSSAAPNTTVRNVTYGPSDADFGLRYRASVNPIEVLLEGTFLIPLYPRPDPNSWNTFTAGSELPRGNGSNRLQGLLTLQIPIHTGVNIGTNFGYAALSGGYSSQVPYGVFVSYEKPRTYFGRLGIAGQLSTRDDQYSADTNPAQRANTALAGSKAFNAVNPAFSALDVAFGTYIGSNFFLSAQMSLPIRGDNIPREPTFGAGMGIDIGGMYKQNSYEHSNRGFQQYYLASKVVKTNNELRQILIDRGENDGIRRGEILDVFEPDSGEGTPGRAMARGVVTELGMTRSKLQIRETFIEGRIEEGFVVRRPVH